MSSLERLVREVHGYMTSPIRDLRFTFRSFRRRPGFVAVAMVTVGLGIGANVAIVSVVRAP